MQSGFGLSLAGVRFRVEPESWLTSEDRAALERLHAAGALPDSDRGGESAPFALWLTGEAPWPAAPPTPADGPAAVDWTDGRVRVRHEQFQVAIDALQCAGVVFRRTAAPAPLEIALRVALSSRLPLVGGVPLHAAGLVIDGRGVAFFGPSGAGKSTIAGLSPWPVLSDELVAVVSGAPFDLVRSGFWGTLGDKSAPGGRHRLAALVELEKGTSFRIERIAPRAALRRLMGVALVPAGPPLWGPTIGVLGALAAAVPCFRMAWSPAAPPWDEIARTIGRAI